jgi:Flp pilus assembly pilin Flp
VQATQCLQGTIAAEWPQVLAPPRCNRLQESQSPHRSSHVVQARPFSRTSERGQALIEYAAIVAVVGACLVAILGLLGRATNRVYERTASAVSLEAKENHRGGGGGVMLTGTASGGRRGGRGPAEPPPDSAAGAGSEEPAGPTTDASR